MFCFEYELAANIEFTGIYQMYRAFDLERYQRLTKPIETKFSDSVHCSIILLNFMALATSIVQFLLNSIFRRINFPLDFV